MWVKSISYLSPPTHKKRPLLGPFLNHYIWSNTRLYLLYLLLVKEDIEDHTEEYEDNEYRYPTPRNVLK